MPEVTQPQGRWVRLFLETQTEGSYMPREIAGFMTSETPNHYMLQGAYIADGMGYLKTENIEFINKTYVYRMQIVDGPPEEDDEEYEFNDNGGGLG